MKRLLSISILIVLLSLSTAWAEYDPFLKAVRAFGLRMSGRNPDCIIQVEEFKKMGQRDLAMELYKRTNGCRDPQWQREGPSLSGPWDRP